MTSNLSVLIPFGGGDPWRETLFDWLVRRYETLLPDAELVVGTSAEPFNRSAARNDAFRKSSGDVLLVADADTVFHVDQIRRAVKIVTNQRAWVLPYGAHQYYNLTAQATARILAQDPAADVAEPRDRDDWEFKLESWAGLLVMPRAAYEAAGGYDESFKDWGGEDVAMRCALDALWAPHLRTVGHVEHLHHPVTESVRFGQPHIRHNLTLQRRYERAAKHPKLMRRMVAAR